MYREFFAHSPLLALPVLSLGIFITVFSAVLVRALRRPPSRDALLAGLPLADETEARHER